LAFIFPSAVEEKQLHGPESFLRS